MARFKYANSTVVKSSIGEAEWEGIRLAAISPALDFRHKTAKVVLQEYQPSDFLLSHCTIIASVDTEPVNAPLGRHMVDGFQIDRKFPDYYITPGTSKYVNNNCFVAGTAILMGDGTEKPIEEVVVGDMVVSHTGTTRRVTETFVHPFRGRLSVIRRLGDARTLEVTAEHPFFGMTPALTCACGCGTRLDRRARKAAIHRFQDYVRGHGCRARKNPKPDFGWVSAGLLEKGDFLSNPVLQGEVTPEGVTPGKARILGYYLAEGYFHRQKPHRVSKKFRTSPDLDGPSVPAAVSFALNLDETDTLVAEIQRLLREEFGVGSSVQRVSGGGVAVHSQQSLELVQFLQQHATCYAKTKRVAGHVLQWPVQLQREIVQGWIEGDGCVQGTAGGWLSVTSASPDLISQMHVLLGRLGVFATRHVHRGMGRKRVRVANGGIQIVNDDTKTCVAYSLQIGSVFAGKILGGSFLESLYLRTRARGKATLGFRVRDDRTMFPIRSATKKAFEGKVYNFETEVDHSYVANGVAVHNSDSWERKLLLSCFRTFIGGENYCFVPGTMIVMADGVQKPIEQVTVGDEVLTHEGRARRVSRVFSRAVDEDISAIYVDHYKAPIKCTRNHPFRKLAVRVPVTDKYKGSKQSSNARYVLDATRKALRDGSGPFAGKVLTSQVWTEAGALGTHDFLLGPRPSEQSGGDRDLAVLLGYYLSEGCLYRHSGRVKGIVLTFGSHEQSLADHAMHLARRSFGAVVHCRLVGSVLRVEILGPSVGDWFLQHGGEYSHTKRISREVLGWSRECLLSILAGWVTGDAQLHRKTERVVGSTVSSDLACQMFRLCEIVGVKASLWKETEAGFRKRQQIASTVVLVVGGEPQQFDIRAEHPTFNVIVSRGSLSAFSGLTPRWKGRVGRASRKRDNLAWFDGTRLHSVAWVGEDRYQGTVHNFEVEEDNSYVLGIGGVAVHNCEHIQIPEMSKGKIIDAAARDIGDSIYVDILIATHRKNKPLIEAITSGKIGTLSMGCFLPGTAVTLADGRRVPIEEVAPGDMVLTHKGRARAVLNKQVRNGHWGMRRISVAGVPDSISATDNHPFFVLRPAKVELVQADQLAVGDYVILPRLDAEAANSPITHIENFEYQGDVHNMEVDEDNSYQVQGIATHNCSVEFTTCTKCGNVAEDETHLCFPPGTRVLRPDGLYIPIEDVVEGDQLITHKGNTRPVLKTMSRTFDGLLTALTVEGVPSTLRSTQNHPYWVLRPATTCACGCGSPLARTVEHERGDSKAFLRRFRPGHNTRLCNPNQNVAVLRDYNTDVEFEFVKASDINKGDYLAFPIPIGSKATIDATVEKARLIGYFAAEGSFIKRNGAYVGVDFCFGEHEHDTLAEETRTLLDRVFGRPRRAKSFVWQDEVAKRGIKPIVRRKTSRPVPSDLTCLSCAAPSDYLRNSSFKPGHDCYICKICGRGFVVGANHDLTARVLRNRKGACIVRMFDGQVAEFFRQHCGEYASAKKLSPEVMGWPSEIQGHVLRCWLGGDGTQNKTGIRGNSSSFNLASQMHVLAARSGMYARRAVIFGGRSADIQDVVNGDGSVTVRDSRGWLPSFSVTCPEPRGFSGEVRFNDAEKASVTLSRFTDSFKKVGNWLLYRVRETRSELYSGMVHNVEVAEDHSYVVEGVAVHNCPHIRYFKGSEFVDELGNKRKIAELCGHVGAEPGSVKFIEASWVANPAFTGAVLRSILNPDEVEGLSKKIQVAFSEPARMPSGISLMKAAQSESSENFNLLKLAQEGEELAQGQQDQGQAPSPPSSKEEKPAEDPLHKIVQDLSDLIRERAVEQIKKEIGGDEAARLTGTPENQNDTLIKSAFKLPAWRTIGKVVLGMTKNVQATKVIVAGLVLHKSGGWQAVKRGGFTGLQMLAISRVLDKMQKRSSMAGESRVYQTVIAVGGSAPYADVETYLAACRQVLNRQLSGSESGALLEKGRIYSLGS
jgi:hypothetical protein